MLRCEFDDVPVATSNDYDRLEEIAETSNDALSSPYMAHYWADFAQRKMEVEIAPKNLLGFSVFEVDFLDEHDGSSARED